MCNLVWKTRPLNRVCRTCWDFHFKIYWSCWKLLYTKSYKYSSLIFLWHRNYRQSDTHLKQHGACIGELCSQNVINQGQLYNRWTQRLNVSKKIFLKFYKIFMSHSESYSNVKFKIWAHYVSLVPSYLSSKLLRSIK